MGFFEKRKDEAAKAQTKREGKYVQGDGQYIARIEKCWIGENRTKDQLAFVQTTLLHRLDPGSNHSVGEEVTPLAVKEKSDYFWGEISSFIANITGEDVNNMDRDAKIELMTSVFESDNPLGGTIIEFSSEERVKKDAKEKANPGPKDRYTVVSFKRQVPATEVADLLTPEELQRFFPGDALEKLIEAEQAAA